MNFGPKISLPRGHQGHGPFSIDVIIYYVYKKLKQAQVSDQVPLGPLVSKYSGHPKDMQKSVQKSEKKCQIGH